MRSKLLITLSITICSCNLAYSLYSKMSRNNYNLAVSQFNSTLIIQNQNIQKNYINAFYNYWLNEHIMHILRYTRKSLEESLPMSVSEYNSMHNYCAQIKRPSDKQVYMRKLNLHSPFERIRNNAIRQCLEMRASTLLKNFIYSSNIGYSQEYPIARKLLSDEFSFTAKMVANEKIDPNLPCYQNINHAIAQDIRQSKLQKQLEELQALLIKFLDPERPLKTQRTNSAINEITFPHIPLMIPEISQRTQHITQLHIANSASAETIQQAQLTQTPSLLDSLLALFNFDISQGI